MASNSKYKLFAEQIEEQITSGKFVVGDYLPGERTLAKSHEISRIAIRMGLKSLQEKGLLEAVPGKGYKVSSPNDKPVKQKSGQIGVVFAGVQSLWPTNLMVDGIFEVLYNSDYQFIFSTCSLSIVRQRKIIKSMIDRGVDGLIVVPEYRKSRYWEETDEDGNFKFLKEVNDNIVPVVLMDRSFKSSGIPCVSNDDPAIMAAATQHLIDLGHRDIVLFAASSIERISRLRYEGYCDCMAKNKLKVNFYSVDKNYHNLYLSAKASYKELSKMRKMFPEATALIAPGVFAHRVRELQNKKLLTNIDDIIGIGVPPENNMEFYPYIERPMVEIAKLAAKKIIRLINHEPVKRLEEFLPSRVIIEHVAEPENIEI